MSDILSAMREFRALDDKRRSQGLLGEESERWNSLRDLLKGDLRNAEPKQAPKPAAVPAHVELAEAFLSTVQVEPFARPATAAEAPAEPEPPVEPEAPAEPELPIEEAPVEAQPAAEPDPLEPAGTASAPQAAASHDGGYAWHAESGLYWHAGAQHWYEPNSGTYYDVNGGVLDPAAARASAAAAIQPTVASASPGAEPAAANDQGAAADESTSEHAELSFDLDGSPDDAPDLASGAELLHLAAEAAETTDSREAIPLDEEDAPAAAAAAFLDEDASTSSSGGLIEDVGTLDLASPADFLADAAAASGGAPAFIDDEGSFELSLDDDGGADPQPQLLGAVDVDLEPTPGPAFDAAEAAPTAPGPTFSDAPAADPWADTLRPATPGPEPIGGGWEFVVAPLTPGPASPSVDLWASATEREAQQDATPVPASALLPFEASRVPEADDTGVEAAIEAGFDGWGGPVEPVTAVPAEAPGVDLPWVTAEQDQPPAAEEFSFDEEPEPFAPGPSLTADGRIVEARAEAPLGEEPIDLEAPVSVEEPIDLEAPISDEEPIELGAPDPVPAIEEPIDLGAPDPVPAIEDPIDLGAPAAPAPPAVPVDRIAEAPVAADVIVEELVEEAIVLEEVEALPAPAPPPAAPLPPVQASRPLPPAAQPTGARGLVTGEHRVVIHTREGVVKRGLVTNVDLTSKNFTFQGQDGKREEVATATLKAVFLMRTAGDAAPEPSGQAVRITFIDGRPLQGWATDLTHPVGFFLVPSDTRGLASRVFVYRASVRDVSIG